MMDLVCRDSFGYSNDFNPKEIYLIGLDLVQSDKQLEHLTLKTSNSVTQVLNLNKNKEEIYL